MSLKSFRYQKRQLIKSYCGYVVAYVGQGFAKASVEVLVSACPPAYFLVLQTISADRLRFRLL